MSSKYLPKVTIVTITYNAQEYIERTINSVLEQEYKNIEYIIIDGNSTDNTMNIVEKYKNKIDLIISEADNGIYDAMNKGLSYATGDWVNFLNAGDLFYNKNTLKRIFERLPEEIDLVYGDWINIDGRDLNLYIESNPLLNVQELKSKFQMNHQSLFVKIKNVPRYDTNYKIKADYQWVIDIVRNLDETHIQYINEPLVLYDIEGISAKQLLLNLNEYIYLTNKNFGKIQVLKNIPIYLKYLIKYVLFKLNLRK